MLRHVAQGKMLEALGRTRHVSTSPVSHVDRHVFWGPSACGHPAQMKVLKGLEEGLARSYVASMAHGTLAINPVK